MTRLQNLLKHRFIKIRKLKLSSLVSRKFPEPSLLVKLHFVMKDYPSLFLIFNQLGPFLKEAMHVSHLVAGRGAFLTIYTHTLIKTF